MKTHFDPKNTTNQTKLPTFTLSIEYNIPTSTDKVYQTGIRGRFSLSNILTFLKIKGVTNIKTYSVINLPHQK